MLSLHTNAAALSTQNALGGTNKALSTSMTRLGTGFRVNSAMDDAAGLQIATRLNAQTAGMKVAQKNTQNGISFLQTAEGALDEVKNILIRMKDLATEFNTATTSDNDKIALEAEYADLLEEYENITTNTSFGGLDVFGDALAATMTFQIGASTGETLTLDATTQTTAVVTHGLADLATDTIDTINDVITAVSTLRSKLGATANRLEHTYNNLGNMIQNVAASEGRIMDVDYATETSNMTSKQMLMQASTAMLKQSSSMSQMVASLLQ